MLCPRSSYPQKFARSLVSDMRYVERIRLLEYWGVQDSALTSEFRRSKFMLMIDRKPLVKKSGCSIRPSFHSYSELQLKLGDYGLTFDMSNSCLLDAVDECNDLQTLKKFRSTHLPRNLSFYVPLFGASLKAVEPTEDAPFQKQDVLRNLGSCFGAHFMDLRMAMLVIASEKHRNLLAKFQALSRWSRVYRRCPKCGAPLRMRVSKSAAHCASCDSFFYPTINPVAITLVCDLTDSFALLVRHKGSVAGVYTAIAGFVQCGESLEECVRREVAEEVGLPVSSVISLNRSQPWPIPESSMMCAHYATADMSEKIDACPGELETARWFSREEVASALRRTLEDPFLKTCRGAAKSDMGETRSVQGLPKDVEDRQKLVYIPPHGAIAHQMIRQWVERGLSLDNS